MSLRIFRLFFLGGVLPHENVRLRSIYGAQSSVCNNPAHPTHSWFFLLIKKNHDYLLLPDKKNFYRPQKFTLNSHLTQNCIGYTTCGQICLRPGAGTVFIWPWQSAPKHHASFRLFTQPSSLLRFLLGLTSLLFKNLYTINLNLPDSLKQRCTMCTTTLCATVDHVTSQVPSHTHREKEISGEKI